MSSAILSKESPRFEITEFAGRYLEGPPLGSRATAVQPPMRIARARPIRCAAARAIARAPGLDPVGKERGGKPLSWPMHPERKVPTEQATVGSYP
jgi:hypothetical protein